MKRAGTVHPVAKRIMIGVATLGVSGAFILGLIGFLQGDALVLIAIGLILVATAVVVGFIALIGILFQAGKEFRDSSPVE